MTRMLAAFCMFLLLVTCAAYAQTSTGSGDTLADRQPAENVRGGAVNARAPGRIVDFARARHTGLRDARLAAQRSGDTSALLPEAGTVTGLGSYSGSSALMGLVNSFLNTGTGTSGGTSTTGGSTSGLPPEVIQMLTSFGIDVNSLNLRATEDSGGDTTALAKEAETSQTSTTQEESDFAVRWANAMLSTMFTSLTLAVSVQSTDFVELLKDLFRPLFGLEDPNAADASDGTTSSSRARSWSGDRFCRNMCRSWIPS
jgi:hypothetical protein